MAIILLISDFQSDSYKTGLFKTLLFSKISNIKIVDITHQIRLNNTIEAAFVCKQIQNVEDQGYITIVKVGSSSELIVYKHLLNLFIFPNNGLLSMVFENFDQKKTYLMPAGSEIEIIKAFESHTLDALPKFSENIVIKYNKTTQINNSMAVAECLFFDGNGNCFFNITQLQFEEFCKDRLFQIRIQHYTGHVFQKIYKSVIEVGLGDALFTFSKNGYLKLQINQGNAKQLFRIKDDSKIIIELK